MANRRLARVLNQIRGTAIREDGGFSDAQLLERFTATGDQAAFELLVWRHRRLVFGVCRRILHDFHEAEDAFQATFLTLARRAGSIGKRTALASWLYTVAFRVALTARAGRARRAARGQPLGTAAEIAARTEPATPAERTELGAVVDEEVSRLPERFRAVTVLCYFEGLTIDEAATHLGCPRGTVASRLARARARLRARLTRRGLTLTAGAVAVGLTRAAGAVALPDCLVHQAVCTMRLAAAGKAGTGMASPVMALTEEVLKTMFVRKIATAALLLVAFAGVLLVGSGLALGVGTNPGIEPLPAAAGDEKQVVEKEPRPAGAPALVTVSHPVQRKAAPFEYFNGRLEAVRAVELRALVSGQLQQVLFKAGADVKKGELLYEIDSEAYSAAFRTAQADVLAAEAQRKRRQAELQRARRLQAQGSMTQDVLDQLTQESAAADAAHSAALAAHDRARRNLEARRITAPIDGRVDRPLVSPGAQVFGGDQATILTTITALQPIGVRFDMDERSFLRYQRLVAKQQVKGSGSPLYLRLGDEEEFQYEGTLDHFESRVKPETGTIGVHGTLPNADRLLLPGMSIQARMPVGQPRPVLAVPEDAVATDPAKRPADVGRRYVLVVNDRNVVERRDVQLGLQEGGMRVIEGGLRSDEWVVIAGAKGVQPGYLVEPRRKGAGRD